MAFRWLDLTITKYAECQYLELVVAQMTVHLPHLSDLKRNVANDCESLQVILNNDRQVKSK